MTESNATEKKPTESEPVNDTALVALAIEVPVTLSHRIADYTDDELEEAAEDIVGACYSNPLTHKIMIYYEALVNQLREVDPGLVAHVTPCAGVLEKEPI